VFVRIDGQRQRLGENVDENLKHGELQRHILLVLQTYDRWATAAEIISDLSDRDIHTTEGSVYVTLKRMKDSGKLKASGYYRCACCKRRLIGYKA